MCAKAHGILGSLIPKTQLTHKFKKKQLTEKILCYLSHKEITIRLQEKQECHIRTQEKLIYHHDSLSLLPLLFFVSRSLFSLASE